MQINNAQELPTTTTNEHERLTWDEMCRRYPDEWVVIAEIDWVDEGCFEFSTALVVAHRKTRKEASPDVKQADKRYQEVGAFFTGRLVPPPYEVVP
jgi:hypothetical protein